MVLGRGLLEIARRDDLVPAWRADLALHGNWPMLLLASALVFPKLALGLSGFETGVSVMPLVEGGPGDAGAPVPLGRVRNTRRLLAAAAAIMCVLLLLSSVVTTMLVPESAYAEGGKASGRAIAFLAHGMLGPVFGTVYDLWTIAILWFAGASAMAGLLNLIPRYLPRFGMAPHWTAQRRPLVLLLFGVSAVVTWIFRADVESQAGAYATGVMVLMLSAAFAVALALWKEGGLRRRLGSAYFWGVTGVFAFTLVDIVAGRPDGLLIASVFIVAIVGVGALSRFVRATELRVMEVRFADAESRELWKGMTGKRVNLVPLADPCAERRGRKASELRRFYAVQGPLAFLHVRLSDNRSEFLAPLRLRIRRVGEDYTIEAGGALAIANTIAYVSELLDPTSLFLGLTVKNQMSQSFRYLLLGEGETGLMVYKILLRYWEWTPGEDVRPHIFLMSE